MKMICTAALLLSSSTLFAQRFDITAFAGGTWSKMTENPFQSSNVAKLNVLGAAELRYHPLRRLSIGLGVSAEKLSTGLKAHVANIDKPELSETVTLTANIGQPVITAYLIAGVRLPLGKYTLAPEITGGYVLTQKASSSGMHDLNYGKGNGSMVGLQLSVSRPVARIFSLGIRAGIKYYSIKHDQPFFDNSKTLSIPLGIQATVKI